MSSQLLPENFDFEEGAPFWAPDVNQTSIERQFTFKDFEQAFQFMTLCARYAQEIDHHPDWSNSWNKVRVRLTTHSAEGLTELDIRMARQMNNLAEQVQKIG
jgi:4a-hydroxytetrahydrobiopterin dehydratase